MAKRCALSTGYMPRGGLPRNSVDRITDRPDMTTAVDRGRKASTQTNKQNSHHRCAFLKSKMSLIMRHMRKQTRRSAAQASKVSKSEVSSL